VLVERGRSQDAESLHDGEARPVDDREVLVGERLTDPEGDLEVGGRDRLDSGRAATDRLPPLLGGTGADAVGE
jgi:hypothetical protein